MKTVPGNVSKQGLTEYCLEISPWVSTQGAGLSLTAPAYLRIDPLKAGDLVDTII